jgi:hypothetical protein
MCGVLTVIHGRTPKGGALRCPQGTTHLYVSACDGDTTSCVQQSPPISSPHVLTLKIHVDALPSWGTSVSLSCTQQVVAVLPPLGHREGHPERLYAGRQVVARLPPLGELSCVSPRRRDACLLQCTQLRADVNSKNTPDANATERRQDSEQPRLSKRGFSGLCWSSARCPHQGACLFVFVSAFCSSPKDTSTA